MAKKGVSMRFVLFSLAFTFMIGCGEDTPCEKLVDVWKKICKPSEGNEPCFPCACAICGMSWEIPTRLGMPDIMNSSCTEPEPCKGAVRDWAETCLEHAPSSRDEQPLQEEWYANDCDPRRAHDIWICDDTGNFNPAFPESAVIGPEMYAHYCREW